MAATMTALAGSRTIGKVVTTAKHKMNSGFTAARFPSQLRFDPFLNVDHFWMSQPTFPPHPHAGFSAVTYMLEDSEGSIFNRDSHGYKVMINPGDTLWTTAGSGVLHEEVPSERGKVCHGLQIFCDLATADKQTPPSAQHLAAKDLPTYETPGGGRVKVVAGSSNGLTSPLRLPTPIGLLDVRLPPGASFRHALDPSHHNAVVLMISGSAAFGPGAQRLGVDQAADFENDGDAIAAVNDAAPDGASGPTADAHFVLFSGRPLQQPVVWHGPFCGSSKEQVAGWVQAYRSGKMGTLQPYYGDEEEL